MTTNLETGMICPNDYQTFENVLKIRQNVNKCYFYSKFYFFKLQCISDKNKNYKLGLIEYDSLSEDEK